MPTGNLHTDVQQKCLLQLLSKLAEIRKDLGGYIEHYYHSEKIIVVKLTNGVLKIDDLLFEKQCISEQGISDKELKNLASSFNPAIF